MSALRGILASARTALAHASRGPAILAVFAAFAVLAADLPAPAGRPRAEMLRESASWLLAAGAAPLLFLAVLRPAAGGAAALRRAESRLLGPRRAAAGHLLATALLLLVVAGGLGLGAYAGLSAALGRPERPTADAPFRRVAWSNAEEIVLRPGRAPVRWEAPRPEDSDALLLDLKPRLRWLDVDAAASRPAAVPGCEVSWSAGGGPRRRAIASFPRGAPCLLRLSLEGAAERGGTVAVEMRATAAAAELDFEPGDAALLGGRAPALSSVIRGFLVLAFGALGVAAACQWFGGFCSAPLAVAATFTFLGAAAAARFLGVGPAGAVRWASIVLGRPLSDPADLLLKGRGVGWGDVADAALRAAPPVILACAFAWIPRRKERAP